MTLHSCTWRQGVSGILLLCSLVTMTTGCRLYRRVAGIPDKTTVAEQVAEESAPVETPRPLPPPEPVEEPKVEEPPVEETKVEAPPVEEPKVEAPPVEAPKVEAPPVEAPKVDSVPEVDEVSIVDPAEPRLLSEDEEVPLASLDPRVERAETLSAALQERQLAAEIAAQVDSGRAFLQNAKDAREAGDMKRADVLIDKCLALLEDAEQQTRP